MLEREEFEHRQLRQQTQDIQKKKVSPQILTPATSAIAGQPYTSHSVSSST